MPPQNQSNGKPSRRETRTSRDRIDTLRYTDDDTTILPKLQSDLTLEEARLDLPVLQSAHFIKITGRNVEKATLSSQCYFKPVVQTFLTWRETLPNSICTRRALICLTLWVLMHPTHKTREGDYRSHLCFILAKIGYDNASTGVP